MRRNRRFKDVLFALASAAKFEIVLTRIQLQKLIYLGDVFSAVWREVSRPADFFPYERGPWDRQIQNAVDALAFRGFVRVEARFLRLNQVRSSYSLSALGCEIVENLRDESVLCEEIQLYDEIASEVARRGWEEIVQIVYSEPTYLAALESCSGSRLYTNRPEINQTMQLASRFKANWSESGHTLTPKIFVQIMFLVFDEIMASKSFLVEVE